MSDRYSSMNGSGTESADTIKLIIAGFCATETLLYISAVICCLILLGLIVRMRLFHSNLRILLANMAIACILQGVTRVKGLYRQFFDPESYDSKNNLFLCWFESAAYMVALYLAVLSLISLAIERLFATVYVKTYETSRSVILGVTLVIIQWLFAWGVILVSQFNLKSGGIREETCGSQGYLSGQVLAISFYLLLFASIISVLIFIFLLYTNKRRYTATFLNPSTHSLSERYQLSENIKTSRLLYPVVTANAICTFFGIAVAIFIVLNTSQSALAKITMQLSSSVTTLLLAVYAAIFPWLSVHGHPEFRTELRKAFRYCAKERIEPKQARNANGVVLVLDHNKERSLHFEALNNAWNA